MFGRDNRGKDKTVDENKIAQTSVEEEAKPEQTDKSELEQLGEIEQSEKAQKILADVQILKEKIERLKVQKEQLINPAEEKKTSGDVSAAKVRDNEYHVDDEAVKAAERAVIEQARRDAVDDIIAVRREHDKEERIREAFRKKQEAEERLRQKRQEAEEKHRKFLMAEKNAAEMKSKRQHAEIQADMHWKSKREEHAKAVERQEQSARALQRIEKRIEQEKIERKKREELRVRQIKKEQERQLKKMAAEEKREAAARFKVEEQRKKAEREKLINEQREIQRRRREEARAEEKRVRQARDAKRREEREERKKRIKQIRRERSELRRQRRLARRAAEMGGGVVNIHGTTVQTEIRPVPAFSFKDILGNAKKKEIGAAETEEEKRALLEENDRIKNEARTIAAQLAEARRQRRKDSSVYKKAKAVWEYCENKKKPLLIAFSAVLMVVVGIAGVLNYYTVYEYSYNGTSLGYIKNKDDVLQITGMVQEALTEDKNVDVVIDASDDISFDRVYTFNKEIVIDSTDDVLKRLTYMGDINIKAYGIYVEGQKVGAVADKDAAKQVLLDMVDQYASGGEGTEIKEAAIVEDVEVKKGNTPLGDVLSEEEMVTKLSTDSVKETIYTIKRGDTLESIAKNHNLTEADIIEDNKGVKDGKLQVGNTLILREVAPLITVRIVEVRNYEEKIDYETVKKKDSDLYEGDVEVDQKGKKGLSELTEKTISMNGEVVETENLKNEVKEEPVDKIVRVGTKERPPTVGSGTYIWPAYEGTYVVTSEFKWRWGRQHEGIDMGCSTGTDVLASDGGTVVYAGWMSGYGNLVIIDHQNGVETYYGHNSSLLVSVGDKVFQGQHIAEAGNTGYSFGSHIHFGVKDNGTFKNPRNYLP